MQKLETQKLLSFSVSIFVKSLSWKENGPIILFLDTHHQNIAPVELSVTRYPCIGHSRARIEQFFECNYSS